MTDAIFVDSVKLHRQQSDFFPTPKNISDCYRQIVNKPKDFVMLPENTVTEDERPEPSWMRKIWEAEKEKRGLK